MLTKASQFYRCRQRNRLLIWLTERELAGNFSIGRSAGKALDEAFAAKDDDILFHLPVTEGWLSQLTLALILVCHSSTEA